MKRVVICDVDNTIANVAWRESYIAEGWDVYHALATNDKPFEDIVNLLKALDQASYYIIGVTSRPEKWRKLTMEWLIKYEIPMHDLWMRPPDDFRGAHELKIDLINRNMKDPTSQISFVLEDREDVVSAFRALGITTLQVSAHDRCSGETKESI